MADDKTKKGQQDRLRINPGERYEVEYEARKTGREPDEVRKAARAEGPMREDVEKALQTGRASGGEH